MTFDPASLSLVHTIPGADAVAVTPELPYADGLTFDLYRPAGPGPHPVVVLVQGYGSDGPRMSARPMRAWASYVGWARLLAASGVAAVNYGPRTPDDGRALVEHLRADAAALDLDPARLGLWACSGHGPAALWLAAHTRPACAAFLYAYLLDLPGATEVAAGWCFDFENVGAHIREHDGGVWDVLVAGEVEHLDPVERTFHEQPPRSGDCSGFVGGHARPISGRARWGQRN